MSNVFNSTRFGASLDIFEDNDSVIYSDDFEYGFSSEYQTYEIILILSCAAILVFVTIIGNLLVIISVGINKRLRTLTNYFIVSLSISDIAVGIFSIPMFTVYFLLGYWPFGSLVCDLWLSLDFSMTSVSSLHLLLICIDRFLSVQKPLTYRPNRTFRRVLSMIIFTWIFSIFLFTPWIFIVPAIHGSRTVPDWECYIQFLHTNPYLTFLTNVMAFWLPVSLMIGFYLRVYKITKDHVHFQLQHANNKDLRSPKNIMEKEHQSKKDKLKRSVHDKAAKILSAILLSFIITWMPYNIAVIISYFCENCISSEVYAFCNYLLYMNSAVDPFLYALCNKDFRQTFVKILSWNVKDIQKQKAIITASSQQNIYTTNLSDVTQSTA